MLLKAASCRARRRQDENGGQCGAGRGGNEMAGSAAPGEATKWRAVRRRRRQRNGGQCGAPGAASKARVVLHLLYNRAKGPDMRGCQNRPPPVTEPTLIRFAPAFGIFLASVLAAQTPPEPGPPAAGGGAPAQAQAAKPAARKTPPPRRRLEARRCRFPGPTPRPERMNAMRMSPWRRWT